MSKAEDRALEKYPVKEYVSYGPYPGASGPCEFDDNKPYRIGFIEGYHQAEKDLELSWEDMMLIHRCIKDAMNFHLYKMMEGVEGQKIVYQEVLKRFRAQKIGNKNSDKSKKCSFSNNNYTEEERRVLCMNCEEECSLLNDYLKFHKIC